LLLAAGRIEAERRSVDQLRAKLDELSDAEPRGLQTLDVFERNIDREIKRAKKFDYPLSVLMFSVEIPAPAPPPFILGILRARAGNALINSIRDIDSATRLDDERFLVLSPYTDLSGATNLARRIVAAVAKGDPVVSSGRTFFPRVVGGVAGAKRGEAVTYTKLVKEATQALENARRDGAELAGPSS
jgi:PleD family two-component response regulator